MRISTVPSGARHIRTYAEFQSYLGDFARGIYKFLWIVGRTGLSKSEAIKAATRTASVYYQTGGQLTPLQFYLDLYQYRHQPIILDDAEHLLDDKRGSKLVSALGEMKPEKQLCYGSTTKQLGETPKSFFTKSSLCIIANKNTSHAALQSRAVTLYFDPSNLETHTAVAIWFHDQEIHDWFGAHLSRLKPLDCRLYNHAVTDKQAHRDWRRLVLETHAPDKISCIIQDLEVDPAYPTVEDKANRFIEVMGTDSGASRSSYYRFKKKLKEQGQLTFEVVPPMRLFGTRPTEPTAFELDAATQAVTQAVPRATTRRNFSDHPDADKTAWERSTDEPPIT